MQNTSAWRTDANRTPFTNPRIGIPSNVEPRVIRIAATAAPAIRNGNVLSGPRGYTLARSPAITVEAPARTLNTQNPRAQVFRKLCINITGPTMTATSSNLPPTFRTRPAGSTHPAAIKAAATKKSPTFVFVQKAAAPIAPNSRNDTRLGFTETRHPAIKSTITICSGWFGSKAITLSSHITANAVAEASVTLFDTL